MEYYRNRKYLGALCDKATEECNKVKCNLLLGCVVLDTEANTVL